MNSKTIVEYAMALGGSTIIVALAWPIDLVSWKMLAIAIACTLIGFSDRIAISKRFGLWPWELRP